MSSSSRTWLSKRPAATIRSRSSGLLVGPASREFQRQIFERQPPPHHFGPQFRLAWTGDLDHQSKTVEQLRPQLAFFGIHGPDQDESRRMRQFDSLALHAVDAHGGRVQQHVDQVVGKQIDFVDIENAPMGRRQQAGLECFATFAKCLFQVQSSQHAIFGGPQGQVDPRHRNFGRRAMLERAAMRAFGPGRVGMAMERAAGHDLDRRTKRGQGAGRRAFGRSLLAANQHAADARIDSHQQQGGLQLVLAHQGRKRIVHQRLRRRLFGAC